MSCDSLVLDGNTSGRSQNSHVTLDLIFKPIRQDVIEEIDVGSLDDGNRMSTKPNVKVLILKNCPSLKAVLSQSEFLRKSHAFVIVVRLSGTYDDNELGQLSDKNAIPVILQINNLDSSRLFFTNTEKQLEEVILADSSSVQHSLCFDFNFVCNLLHSESEKFGKFCFDLVEVKIDPNACFRGKRLIDLAIEHGDLLVLKFLQLFQLDITAFNDDKERVLEIAIRHGNLDILRAVLEIPVEAENFEAYLSPGKRHASNLMSDNDLSLLMLAAWSGKTDVVRFLLKCGLDVNLQNDDEDTASDLAWNNGHLDTVVELLKSDGPFPYYFDLNQLPADAELVKISEERYNLHEQIKNNQIEEVRKFVEHHPIVKCAYDNRSQCALVTALESKNFEIYSFLRSKGYTTGIDRDHNKFISRLTASEKEMLKLSNRKYFPTNEDSHIMDLLARSRLGFGSEQKNFGIVQKYFETLDAIPEVQPILKIISLAKKLDIVFDFKQASVADMDPTQNFVDITVAGRTIYNNGNILIGAKSRDAEILATMAHEFTHYAMHLLYDNEGLPYHATGDESREKAFLKIVDFCEVNQSRNSVIENVFTYPRDEFAVELIVRVPHLLALHFQEPDKIAQVRKDFGNLFEFFTKRVLSECDQEIPIMRAKQKIRDLNQRLGLKREAEASNLFCDNSKIDFDEIVGKPGNILMQSDLPNLVLCNVLNSFKKSGIRNADSLHIFIKLEQFMDSELSDAIREAFRSVTEPKLFVLVTENATEFSKLRRMFNDQMWQSKVVFIAKSILTKKEDEEKFNAGFPIQPKKIEYNWCDLNKTSQAEILSKKLQFQGLEMCLSDVLTADAKILRDLSLEEVFKLSEIRLKSFNESVPPSPDIYIKRTFISNPNDTADPLTAEDAIELLVSDRSLILADDSGMGKTTSALHFSRKLKQRNPHSWVVHIDLKRYTKSYYKDDEVPSDVITSDFFSAKILNLTGRLEMRFFEHFYENEKVIFIIDGFDEISPVYKTCILEVVEAIQKSKNMLLVTTRTHLTTVLAESVPSKIIFHHQFTFDDQVEFLVKFWSRSNKRPMHEFETKARSLLEKFRETETQEDFFRVPLQVRMLAEIYEKADPSQEEIRELNMFSLYKSFIEKKTDIWIERGPLAKKDNTNIQTSRSWNITQIHEKLAIENFFKEDTTKAFKLPEIEAPLTDELLARIGLLQVEGPRKFLFTHQSFSEYFVADFILSNVAQETFLTILEELHQMFLEILQGERFQQVRLFMNGKLEMKEKLDVGILSAKLEKSLEVELNRLFLQNLVKENLSALITFMLVTVTISKTCKVCLISHKSKHGEQALHVAAKFSNFGSFKQLWSCIESFAEESKLAELLFFSKGFHGRNVLNRAILNDNHEISKEILEIASNLMDSGSFKEFLMQEDNVKSNSLTIASKGRPIAFNMIWKAVESKLEAQDQKDLLFWRELDRRNVLLSAVRFKCPEVIQSIIKITQKLFNYEEMCNFLFTEDLNRDTALHSAVYYGDLDVFTLVWSFIKNVLNRIDQKILWQKKLDPNIFMRSVECIMYRNSIAKDVLTASKEILDPEEIYEALTERSFRNCTFVSIATFHGIVDRIFDPEDLEWVVAENEAHQRSIPIRFDGNIEINPIARCLRDALKHDVGAEELKAALYAEAGDGDTALHFALEFGTTFLVDRIFHLADLRLSKTERLELVQTISPSGYTILSRSEMNGLGGVMDSVCNFLVRQLDLVADVKALFFMPDHSGQTFYANTATLNRSCLLVFLDWFKENFSCDALRELFFNVGRNFSSKTLAQEVVEKCDEGLTKKFFDFCLSSFDLSVVQEMMLIQFYDDHDTLGRSLFNPNCKVVGEVWNFYVQILTEVELEELLFKNNQGRVYFKKEEHKNPEAIETLKAIAIERFGEERTRKLTRNFF